MDRMACFRSGGIAFGLCRGLCEGCDADLFLQAISATLPARKYYPYGRIGAPHIPKHSRLTFDHASNIAAI
jgi:hypothetical protein